MSLPYLFLSPHTLTSSKQAGPPSHAAQVCHVSWVWDIWIRDRGPITSPFDQCQSYEILPAQHNMPKTEIKIRIFHGFLKHKSWFWDHRPAGYRAPFMFWNQNILRVCERSGFDSVVLPVVSGFRQVLQRKFIDGNTLRLLNQGKLCDNVCVYESVNICVWQWKCVFDLGRPLKPRLGECKHTLGCVALHRLWMDRGHSPAQLLSLQRLRVMYRIC